MPKGKNRQILLAEKKKNKQQRMKNPSFQSNYSKKRRYLDRAKKFGLEFLEGQKPWKSD